MARMVDMSPTAPLHAFVERTLARGRALRSTVGSDGSLITGFIHFDTGHRCVANHRLPWWNLLYLLEGSGRFRAGQGPWQDLTPGCVLIRPAHAVFSLDRDARGRWCEFMLDFPAAFGREYAALAQLPTLEVFHTRPGRDLFAAMENLVGAARGGALNASLAAAFDFLGRIEQARKKNRTKPRWEQALALLEHQDPRAVAKRLGVPYERFRKAFSHEYGLAPTQWRIRRRMDLARERLRLDRAPINAIAEELGYPDYFSFAKQFKRMTGYTPGAYREGN